MAMPNIQHCVFPEALCYVDFMLSDTPAAVSAEPAQAPLKSNRRPMNGSRLFTLAAVLFVSSLAVVTGLV
jgi:hypothetical protein